MNVINLGTTLNKTMKQPSGTDRTSVPCFVKQTSFTGATDIFTKNFIPTQKEIAEVFANDKACDGIAGFLPQRWYAKLKGETFSEKVELEKKVLHAFRAAVKHLKPYNEDPSSPKFKRYLFDLENKRLKEASDYLTKVLRHFGILPETNSVYFKIRKVHGQYIERGYLLCERGKNPTLEKLFIKTFKKLNPERPDANTNGIYAELAHGLNLNSLKCPYISKIYWGDVKAGYMATEYETPPKHSSPIVHFKKEYNNFLDFSFDFFKQTGIKLIELLESGINPGRTTRRNKFEPKGKEELITGYLQLTLDKVGLMHCDLHKDNAIIGTDKGGKAIVKIVDIGGVTKRYDAK